MSHWLKDFVPPLLWKLARSVRPKLYGWFGNYETWQEAQSDCGGYDSEAIIEKVRTSLSKVKNGEAAFERDGILFEKPEYAWPVLSGLLMAHAERKKLNVLDFGGSLGSTYFQHKTLLEKLGDVEWNIVEQAKFVAIGLEEFQTDTLRYYPTAEECFAHSQPNVLLLGSVIQYIDQPYKLLENLFSHPFEFIIIDRTTFDKNDRHRITVQKVDPRIYDASYPCHLFSESEFLDFLNRSKYELIAHYTSDNEVFEELVLHGFILKLKND